jgi:hypothetical protein
VAASDDAATAELKGAAAKLRAAVQACDARFGLNVASGIPKPQAPYVPPPPPEQSVQTFENREAPSPSPAPSGPSACERIDKRATELMDIWTGYYAAYAADPTYDHLRSLRSDYDNIRSRLEWALRDAESADCYDLARDMRDVLGKWEKPY